NWINQTQAVTPNFFPAPGRHVVTSMTSVPNTDPYGNFNIVAPGGGQHSLKLGDAAIGASAERAYYYVKVPVGVNNYSFNFRFAVVLEDIGHPANTQPRFSIIMTDSATGVEIKDGCYNKNFIAAPT